MSTPSNPSVFNTLPPIVLALATPMALLELGFWMGGRGFMDGLGWRLSALQDQAFIPQIFWAMIQTGVWPLAEVSRFLTYPFLHYSPTHAIMAIVFLLALGKMVGEVLNAVAFLAVFFGSAVFGALIYALLSTSQTVLVGGFPAVYGLIGSFTYMLYVRLGAIGAPQARAFSLIGFLLGIQLLCALIFGGGQDWIADLAGFVAGFGISVLVCPGGFARLRARLQRR